MRQGLVSARLLVSALALLTGVALGGNAPAAAQDLLKKPVRVIVPFGAGSATDVVPRLVFERLSKQIGQPITVENRVGAGGTIGVSVVARARPDGTTLLAHSSAFATAPAIEKRLKYDPVADFVAVGALGSVPNVLVVAPSTGITSVKQFVDAAKAAATPFRFASVGAGSSVHLSAERFRKSAGFPAVHVPLKGSAEAVSEVMAGRVTYFFAPIATALPLVTAGRLTALAVSSPTRAAALPDVPTTLEAGFRDSDYTFWIGVFAPAGASWKLVESLNRGLAEAVADPVVAARLKALGVEPMPLTPEGFAARLKQDVATYAPLARDLAAARD